MGVLISITMPYCGDSNTLFVCVRIPMVCPPILSTLGHHIEWWGIKSSNNLFQLHSWISPQVLLFEWSLREGMYTLRHSNNFKIATLRCSKRLIFNIINIMIHTLDAPAISHYTHYCIYQRTEQFINWGFIQYILVIHQTLQYIVMN